jgi:predicted transcriptional regulator
MKYNQANTVPAEVVLEEIRKRVPLAGTPAGALRAYRVREELTQGELAAKTGIAQGHISEMEKRKRSIGVRSAKMLAKALNCRWEQLVSG